MAPLPHSWTKVAPGTSEVDAQEWTQKQPLAVQEPGAGGALGNVPGLDPGKKPSRHPRATALELRAQPHSPRMVRKQASPLTTLKTKVRVPRKRTGDQTQIYLPRSSAANPTWATTVSLSRLDTLPWLIFTF